MTVKSCYLILYVGVYYLTFITKNSDTKSVALVRWKCKRRFSRRHITILCLKKRDHYILAESLKLFMLSYYTKNVNDLNESSLLRTSTVCGVLVAWMVCGSLVTVYMCVCVCV
jgi:hypothetical protein